VRRALAIGSLAVLIVAAVAYSRLPATRQAGIFNVDPPTPYFRYSAVDSIRGRVLVVHGLDANKRMLNMLSYALADAGLEVFTIDLPGHGESEAPFNALQARNAVAQILEQLGPETLVLGHSLGGAILLDIAADREVKGMALFSPAPTPIGKILASRILLFEGEFDPERLRAFAPEIQEAAEGTVELHDLKWTGHTGGLTQPAAIEQTAEWLGGNSRQIHTRSRLALLLLMFIAALALGTVLLGNPARVPVSAVSSATPTGGPTIVSYVAAAAASAVAVTFVPVAGWLRLFVTDYLIGVLFLTGCILCVLRLRLRLPRVNKTVWVGIAAAIYTIAIPGLFVASEFTQLTLPDGRWWRFPLIAGLSLPLFLADEVLIRPTSSRWKASLMGIATRIVLAAATVTAALTIHREAAFLLLLIPALLIFWTGLWFVGGLVYRRTSDPLATAIFLSLVQGWVFAAIFVTT